MDPRNAYKKRHKAQGLCVCCTLPAVYYGLCPRHYLMGKERKRKYINRKRIALVAQGICPECKTPLLPEMDGNAKRCLNCRENLTANGRLNRIERGPNHK